MNTCDNGDITSSKTVRCIINYMLLEHLLNCRQYLSFQDIVNGTGLSPKTIRRALKILRQLNLVKTVFDISSNRRTLYTLNAGKVRCLERTDDIKPGLYIIDIGLGLPKYLNIKSIRLLRSANQVLYSPNVPRRIIEISAAEHVEDVSKLSQYELKRYICPIESDVRLILIDKILDSDIFNNIVNMIECKENVYYVSNISPIHVALNILEFPCKKRFRFKRDSTTELIISSSLSDFEINNIFRLLKVYRRGESITIASVDLENIDLERSSDSTEGTVYIAYVRT
ncbi:MAG: helix-turn-helix transcriptional regulator [Crenarchaeota archaeon]|nr:helix-turn-helix transcriptional regulator [Thermoproteota archaeon]